MNVPERLASLRDVLGERRLAWLVGAVLALIGVTALIVSCATTGHRRGPLDPADRRGQEIVVCGQLFDIGTPVVLWSDPGGYDAYSELPRFEEPARDADGQPIQRRRYGARSGIPADVAERVATSGWTTGDLRRVVRQFVLHYDVCGTSRQCFKILQDKRNLSVHFLLDVDGTIYQTLDLQERAWHAGNANDRSVGVEIAHIGAYPAPGHPVMRSWYETDDQGLRVRFPRWMTELGIRTPGFVARPERAELLELEIHGKRLWQHDYTAEQRQALAHLAAGLHRVLGIPLEIPRDPGTGGVLCTALPKDDAQDGLATFAGILGHWHVTSGKTDPGPALDWERLLSDARRLADDD
ncbi:MAG: N-acetylmuramoyl-L-alanine amidase [Planctomycetes bacterium]|nr:N-acetylmuramoyl-L-alanine amidase [Planctomycetota bacterium]